MEVEDTSLKVREAEIFTLPLVRVGYSSNYSNYKGANIITNSVSLASSMNILKQNAQFRINYSKDIKAKLVISDKSINNKLFGLYGSEYSLGDIVSSDIPLVTKTKPGNGIFYSTMPLHIGAQLKSNNVVLKGDLYDGYQVDLFHNDQLIDFRIEPDDNNSYYFATHASPGLNIFKLVFYGPLGQIETKIKKIFVPTKLFGTGLIGVSFNAINVNDNLFEKKDASNRYTQLSMETQYGFTNASYLYAGITNIHKKDSDDLFSTVKYDLSVFGIRSDLSVAYNKGDKYAFSFRSQSIMKGVRWFINYSHYNNFISEYTKSITKFFDTDKKFHTFETRMTFRLLKIPVSLRYNYYFGEASGFSSNFSGSFTISSGKFSMTNIISMRKPSKNTDTSVYNGSFTYNINQLFLRGGYTLQVKPVKKLNKVSLSGRLKFNNEQNLTVEIKRDDYNFVNHGITLNYGHDFNNFSLGAGLSYTENKRASLNIRVNFSFGKKPYNNSLYFSRQHIISKATIAPRVFLDDNGNGIFDEDELPLENIGFQGAFNRANLLTDSNGTLFVPGVSPFKITNLKIDTRTLPDISLAESTYQTKFSLKPNSIVKIDIPIITLGEIDGNINIVNNGKIFGGEGLELIVRNIKTNKIIKDITSDYDGYIFISEIPMGNYYISIKKEQLDQYNLCQPKRKKVTLTNNEPFVSISDFHLYKNNDEGNVDILLSENISLLEATKVWDKVNKLLSSIPLNKTYYPYLTSENNKTWKLIIHDIPIYDSKIYCNLIKKSHHTCKTIIKNDTSCPNYISIPES